MRLIDSHAHLQADRFADDLDAVVASARDAGVERILVPGWDVDSCRAAIDLSDRYPAIAGSSGVHPHDAARQTEADLEAIEQLAEDRRIAAVGETGLDYDREFSSREVQLANLRRHLALALRVGKPLILHCRSKAGARDAQDDLIRELEGSGVGGGEWRDRFDGRPPAVVHSYSGPVDYAERALELGLAVSFSGLSFRRGEESTAVVARVAPGDRLLVETDSPYLSPPGADRRRNEPRWVEITARWLAEQRGEDPDSLGERLVANYHRIFGTARRAVEAA